MRYLIDGYNLAVCSGLVRTLDGPGNPERARQRVVAWIAGCLEPDKRPRATVVFDARTHLGQPDAFDTHDLRVLYAVDHEDADSMLEELIRTDSAPRSLTVVSSDHRLRVAAKRRHCVWISSQDWYDQMERAAARPPAVEPASKPESVDDREKLIEAFDTPEIQQVIQKESLQRQTYRKKRRRPDSGA